MSRPAPCQPEVGPNCSHSLPVYYYKYLTLTRLLGYYPAPNFPPGGTNTAGMRMSNLLRSIR